MESLEVDRFDLKPLGTPLTVWYTALRKIPKLQWWLSEGLVECFSQSSGYWSCNSKTPSPPPSGPQNLTPAFLGTGGPALFYELGGIRNQRSVRRPCPPLPKPYKNSPVLGSSLPQCRYLLVFLNKGNIKNWGWLGGGALGSPLPWEEGDGRRMVFPHERKYQNVRGPSHCMYSIGPRRRLTVQSFGKLLKPFSSLQLFLEAFPGAVSWCSFPGSLIFFCPEDSSIGSHS